ncbi:MAG: hypothetical protein HPY65_18475 [Syntrophaceae bacterium]|nr:hypothetical protein [Syntrophaceae bacterium]
MITTKKTAQDILQEELLKERIAVLTRASERLTQALDTLKGIEAGIDEDMALLKAQGESPEFFGPEYRHRAKLISGVNEKIDQFNTAREYAEVRMYYLIVTREALGLRRHQRIEEFYRIPPRKQRLVER